MRSIPLMVGFVLAGLLPASKTFGVPAEDLKQSYQTIVDRNPFNLKPPTPPPTNNIVEKKTEEKPKNDIFLTGIVTVGYPRIPKRAYLMTKEQNKKEPAYYSLSEGQGRDGIEVLAIDENAKTVRIRWDKGETLLSFQTHGITNAPPPAAPGAQPGMGRPGMPAGPGSPPPLTPGGPAATHAGANPATPNNPYAASQPANTGINPDISLGISGRQIPTRPVRVRGGDGGLPAMGGVPNAPAPQVPEVDPAQQYLNLRLQEEIAKREGRVAPPTPPMLQ